MNESIEPSVGILEIGFSKDIDDSPE